MFPKRARIQSRELLDQVARQPCAACGIRPQSNSANDPHHVTSVKSGGGDVESNVMPLCRRHHSEWHQIGPGRMIDRYFGIEQWLIRFERFDVIEKGMAP